MTHLRLLSAATIVLVAALVVHVAEAQPLAQRKAVQALTASELLSLRRGVKQMMDWNDAPRDSANYRRSWIYWANMHQYFGEDCMCWSNANGGLIPCSELRANGMTSDPIPPNLPGLERVITWTQMNPIEMATWCKAEHRNDLFLPWHRLYLWYFEQVLQAAAGDPALRLPYWDYATDSFVPAAYRDATYVNAAGQTMPNPLRVEERALALNAGLTGLDRGVVSAAVAMQATSYSMFNSALEDIPHGTVHCALGVAGCDTGLMGSVPVSPLDPIFHAHHTNIDRLYDCWLRANEAARQLRDQTLLNRTYTFVARDGSPTPLVRVGDRLLSSQLGYAYTACPAAAAVAAVAGAAGGGTGSEATPTDVASAPRVALAGLTQLEPGGTIVPITVPLAAPAGGRVYVVIEGLSVDVVPRALYNVYLADDDGRREQIGVTSFFHFTMPQDGAHAGHAPSTGRYTFDATEAVQQLSLAEAAQPALVFEPTTGLMDSEPAAAAARISPQANVRFDNAWLVRIP